nr:MAG TPA: hypothetical protein [Caudoviricetes sp.]
MTEYERRSRTFSVECRGEAYDVLALRNSSLRQVWDSQKRWFKSDDVVTITNGYGEQAIFIRKQRGNDRE